MGREAVALVADTDLEAVKLFAACGYQCPESGKFATFETAEAYDRVGSYFHVRYEVAPIADLPGASPEPSFALRLVSTLSGSSFALGRIHA